MTTSSRLTAEELSALETDGYVVRESQFTRAEVAEIIAECEDLVANVVAARNGKRYTVGSYTFEPDFESEVTVKWEGDTDAVHGLEPFAHLAPALEKWAYDPRFIEPMIDIVDDPEPVLFTEKLNLKRPHVGGPNPLHQDFPYWDKFADDPTRIATSVLFLDDANLENGTLQVVPGSHTRGQWQTRTDRDFFGNLETDQEAAGEVPTVAVEVPAGSVVMFGAFLVHKSEPNTSSRDRRALLYSYQPKGFTHMLELTRKQMRSRSESKS